MMRSNLCFAGATADKPHARALRTQTNSWPAHGTRKRAARAHTMRAVWGSALRDNICLGRLCLGIGLGGV
eukprot:3969625-Lingulodinium_polyedra.AAC.1